MANIESIPEVKPVVRMPAVRNLLRRVFSGNVGSYAYLPAAAVLILLGLLSIFQLMLILGAPFGRATWGGGHDVLPMNFRIGSAVAIAMYAAILWLCRRRLQFPSRSGYRRALWAVVAYFTVGVFMNVASSSPWERFLMAPVALALAWATFALNRARTEEDPDVHVNS